MLKLLKKIPFLSVFITQFLGAFNDNLFRAAMTGFVTYKLTTITVDQKQLIVTLAVGLFMLPYFLFSALAGEIADKYRKDIIIKTLKFCEILIISLAITGFYISSPCVLLVVLFLMGTQSAFFGPVKYSILPDILEENELIAGNGLFEAGSYLAILQGVVLGGMIMAGTGNGLLATSIGTLSVALLGFLSALFLPKINAVAPTNKISKNFLKLTWVNMKFATIKRGIFLCILGTSWFWLIGAVLISQIPSFAQNVLNADGSVYTFLLTIFSCGIGIGAIVCQSLLKGEVSSKYLPISSIMMTLFLADLAWASLGVNFYGDVQNLRQFISTFTGIRISIDLFLMAFFGGLFMVPLNAMLQVFSDESIRSRVIATGNIINSLFMVVGSAICAVLLAKGFKIAEIFVVMAIANAIVTIYICGLLPEHLVRSFMKTLLTSIYTINIKGVENFKAAKNNTVIIANHTSFLDAVILWTFLPNDVFFAINTQISKKWWIKPFLYFVKYFPIDPTNPAAVKSIINEVRNGKKVVIFPEGRITTTGTLMKVYPGPAMIAEKSDADILPICIDGSQYSIFSRFSKKLRKRPNAEINVNVLPKQKFVVGECENNRIKRQQSVKKLYNVMCDMKFASCDLNRSLFESLVDAYRFVGGKKEIIEDIGRNPLTFNKFLTAICALKNEFNKDTKKGERIGLMLPNSSGVAVAFFALQMGGRVPAMVNYSGGIKNILSCCNVAGIKLIYTSELFVKKANLFEVVEKLKENGIEVINVENIKNRISLFNKLKALIESINPLKYSEKVNPSDEAVVLFTSGSEGTPKGVVLNHKNIQANRYQISSIVDLTILDSFFNAMPVFHSFGLTAGLLLPVLSGIKTFMYPSPLHYRVVPEFVYDTNSTIMFGTDTFLSAYGKVAHPYDFHNMRFVVAGAEKLKDETFNMWAENFGIRIFEGYGATETAPVISLNVPMKFKRGTVGQILPGLEYKLEKVDGISEGGRLFVKGANVMMGYLKSDQPGIIQKPEDGWYDTGDIVNVDKDGFIKILGRAKRFAKIAGEMISLTAIEAELSKKWKDSMHAVISIPDDKKGEQLILFTTENNLTKSTISSYFRSIGLSELWVPREIMIVESIPIIGTGKTDYIKLKEGLLG